MRQIILLLLLFITPACIDKIAFDQSITEGSGILVVSGGLANTDAPQQLSLSWSRTLDVQPFEMVSGAKITLYDDEGHQEEYEETAAGNYTFYSHTITGKAGGTYYIVIELPDGRTYQSRPEQMPDIIRADSLALDIVRRKIITDEGITALSGFIDISIHTPAQANGSAANLRWEIDEAYNFIDKSCSPFDPALICYFFQTFDPQQVLLYDGRQLEQSRLDAYLLNTKPLFRSSMEFELRHFFNVYQHNITAEALDYWLDIKRVANLQGSIFDPPPAAVQGNVFNVNDSTERALGYFEVASVDTIRKSVHRLDIAPVFYIEPYCEDPTVSGPLRSGCCNCTVLDGATLQEPHYFK